MTDFHIRAATDSDLPFLWEMLYQALFIPEGEKRPSRDILKQPELARCLENWGRIGDVALIATDRANQNLGAVWIRHFDELNRTYGYVGESTPILGIALLPEHRGKGVGTSLLHEIISQSKRNQISSISLSVNPENPARRLYERFGFARVSEEGTSWTMVATI
ncbi:GNAT family N-acetyltransferase [Brevibacillus sp. SYSU BS000544]|uniref:GNAT family N-acetyltransferase n=1 Tax=Brevibacillus sp. SYSU BS000544 TaxID=3416443 RepID=UPI003CE4CBCB